MTWTEITKSVQDKVNKIAQVSVTDVVKEVEQQHIQTDVYDVYTPKYYKRRYYNDGLIANDNIVGSMDGNTLEIVNITKPYNNSYNNELAPLVEYGLAYSGNAKNIFKSDMSGEPWANPRPFTANTIKDLKTNKQHVKALKNGLKNYGIKVK